MPEQTTVFHWHGDTFDLPAGSVRLCSSESCVNQGFLSGERVLGLQFHLETTTESMEALIRNCSVELNDAPFIQTAEQMRAGVSHIPEINALLATLLNNLLQVA